MDIAVIANPVASQFTGGAHRQVMSILSTVGEVSALWPGSATEATDAAAKAVAEGARVVVAMGGDGMVHHVGQALVDTDSTLGIIPAGTTNVVARLLGVPTRSSRAAKWIIGAARLKTVGVARMELARGKTQTTHHAMFACGFGLDAEVVRKADADPYRKYRFGSVHYATTAFGVATKSFPRQEPHLEIAAADHKAEATAVLLQFREMYTYFGKLGIKLSGATPDPMTTLVIERLRRSRIPQIAFDVFTRRELAKVKGFQVWEGTDRLELRADPPVAAQADGEGLGIVDAAVVTWQGNALRVLAAESKSG